MHRKITVVIALGLGLTATVLPSGTQHWAQPSSRTGLLAQDHAAVGPRPLRPTHLAAPTLDQWAVQPLWPEVIEPAQRDDDHPLIAVASSALAPVYRVRNGRRSVMGRIRYGGQLRASQALDLPGCAGGTWHALDGGGHGCTAGGIAVGRSAPSVPQRWTAPDSAQVEPFRYGKVESGSLRFVRLPSPAEERAASKVPAPQAAKLDFVQGVLDGIYFIAIVDEVEDQGRHFFRTSAGHYVRAEQVKELAPTGMHGVPLASAEALPIAFVYGSSTTLFHIQEGALHAVGVAEKHARFHAQGRILRQGQRYVVGPDRIAVARESVRIAELQQRPDSIPPDAKWLHLNLAQQTLVAYEGDRPVLATLLSSGIKGRDTPTGLYRLERKYLTKTMSGVDDEAGWYEVAEVPWVFYYKGRYAIHGAYWHNVFGETRSHGCTNIPPADARWLFGWLDPKLPRGWHAMLYRERGWAYFTKDDVELDPWLANSSPRRSAAAPG